MSDAELPRICVLTIQGGGALGVELIGQLKGVTGRPTTRGGENTGDLNFSPVGVAGSSAGAIIATLFWAGYEPIEILEIVKETFSANGREAFFGPYAGTGFSSFADFTTYISQFSKAWAADWRADWCPWLFPRARKWFVRLKLLARGARVMVCHALPGKGLFEASGFVTKLDNLLKQSPRLRDDLGRKAELLTFRDIRALPQLGMVPLFLMVTDVAGAGLRIISSIDNDLLDMPIARAVRASAGFPGFFRPVKLDAQNLCCIDGGVISNLPTWVFDRAFRDRLRNAADVFPGEAERLSSLAALPWHHVSLRLGVGAPPGNPNSGLAFLKSLFSLLTGIGRRHLENTLDTFVAVKRFAVTSSPADDEEMLSKSGDPLIAGVLDFKALEDHRLVERLYDRGRKAAHRCIDDRTMLILPPEQPVLLVLQDLVEKIEVLFAPHIVPGSKIRVNVFLPTRSDILTMAYGCNMAGHVDNGIQLSHGQGVTSLCYLYAEPFLANLRDQLLDVTDINPTFQPFNVETSGDRTWLMSVPILDPLDSRPLPSMVFAGLAMDTDGPIFGTLNIDANLLYGPQNLDSDPYAQSQTRLIRMVFDLAKAAAYELGLLFNDPWLVTNVET